MENCLHVRRFTTKPRRYFGCYERFGSYYDAQNNVTVNDFLTICDQKGDSWHWFMRHPTFFGIVITLLYILLAVYCMLQRKTLSAQQDMRRELLILAQVGRTVKKRWGKDAFQGTIIGVTTMLTNVTFTWLWYIPQLGKTFAMCNSAINPLLYLVFNSKIRKYYTKNVSKPSTAKVISMHSLSKDYYLFRRFVR